MKKYILLISFFWIASETWAQEATTAHKDSLQTVLDQYYKLNLKIFQSQSTVDDIHALFEFFTDDFVYIHPKYGGTYSREDLFEGYINNQREGRYNSSIVDIKIGNKIIGWNAAAIEKRFIEKTPQGTQEGNAEMTLFEFRNGKISKILEYW